MTRQGAMMRAVLLSGILATSFAVGLLAQDPDGSATERFVPHDGSKRPDFALTDLTGRTRTIDEWDGQVLLVDFWASWCVPCRAEMPAFNALRAKYRDRGFEVIGIAADELDKIEAFLAQIPIDFPIVYGDVFDVMDLSAEFGNTYGGLPFNAFVDRDGNVLYVQKPGEVTFEEAEEILLRLL